MKFSSPSFLLSAPSVCRCVGSERGSASSIRRRRTHHRQRRTAPYFPRNKRAHETKEASFDAVPVAAQQKRRREEKKPRRPGFFERPSNQRDGCTRHHSRGFCSDANTAARCRSSPRAHTRLSADAIATVTNRRACQFRARTRHHATRLILVLLSPATLSNENVPRQPDEKQSFFTWRPSQLSTQEFRLNFSIQHEDRALNLGETRI